jgi:hypothetical protein
MLRTQTLPSKASDAPSSLYTRIHKIAVEGLKDVEIFKQSWLDEEMQILWRRTFKERYPQGDSVWRYDYASSLEKSRAQQQLQAVDAEISATASRDPEEVIRDFREKHPSIRFESQGPSNSVPFNIRVAGMPFRVDFGTYGNEMDYQVHRKEGTRFTHLQEQVLEHVNQRRFKDNLEYLLVGICQTPPCRFGC